MILLNELSINFWDFKFYEIIGVSYGLIKLSLSGFIFWIIIITQKSITENFYILDMFW